ncbi:MAG: DAK2 domain-containing protein, partial [Coriobacteriia bacterium]|nr:DAK2 domain-containing protein [Coriobacteriia bacterium]
GGQTMNPSTAELLGAASAIVADAVIFLPNNKNIIMAAQQAATISPVPAAVVPTKSIPEAFAALLAFDASASLEDNVTAMSDAASTVRTGEVTTAIKDSKAKVGPISKGQMIGITADEIEIVGDDLVDVTLRLVEMLADGAEALTLLAGSDLSPDTLHEIEDRIAEAHPGLEIESHQGGQPLYPLIIAAE